MRGEDCTRSREIAEAYEDDPLNFKNANVRWFTECEHAQNQAQERASEIKLPLLCMHGGADKIAQAAATEYFVVRTSSTDREYVLVPDAYHEIMNDPGGAATIDRFATAMLRWRAAAASAGAAAP